MTVEVKLTGVDRPFTAWHEVAGMSKAIFDDFRFSERVEDFDLDHKDQVVTLELDPKDWETLRDDLKMFGRNMVVVSDTIDRKIREKGKAKELAEKIKLREVA